MSVWTAIAEHISAETGRPFNADKRRAIGGGCINSATLIQDGEQRFFVKLNDADSLPMFAAERAGLEEIIATGAIRAPRPLCHGSSDSQAYLVMEYIENGPPRADMALLGEQLAAMHRTQSAQYGWKIDNTIGATPQDNTCDDDWCRFWGERRLAPQLELATRNGYGGILWKRGERLLEKLPQLLDGHQPPPSLLHGDLWSGNYTFDVQGRPVIFDPAVYYGDREADLAMTELFGGFSTDFYRAYESAWPLPEGYAMRKHLYNLYHILNHANLFGGGYVDQAANIIDRLLSETG
ncbi:MAG TPA: fructosamine kinase family protein [Gammaproteobacteria bacterium]|nr:fructosamine kinase family protein [Gammaproteobacteria bacterium]